MVKIWNKPKRVVPGKKSSSRLRRWAKAFWAVVLAAIVLSLFVLGTFLNRYEVIAFGDTYDFIVFDKLSGTAVLYEMFEIRGERRYDSREIGEDLFLRLKKTDILM